MADVALVIAAALLVATGIRIGRLGARQLAAQAAASVQAVLTAIERAAAAQRLEMRRAAEIGGRDEARALGAAADTFSQVREAELVARTRRLAERQTEVALLEPRVAEAAERLAEAEARFARGQAETGRLRAEIAATQQAGRAALERAAGEDIGTAASAIRAAEIEEARLSAARVERAAADHSGGGAAVKDSRRIMDVAMTRFAGHYLTERLLSVVPLVPGRDAGGSDVEALLGSGEANLRAIEAVAGVTLSLTEKRDGIRLEGLDGVGREVARRTLALVQREMRLARDPDEVTKTARAIAATLDRELVDLGRRAFSTLEIPAPHEEIVKLVGRLNYRTSYTQNQWKHAIEAAFLCGMMADEMGLDAKLARRAAVMHDIGKALTHELDGSHAVIGADYARRLGESEVVANAIGAHHTDEPFNSHYAYLVAAADAMSGARPGARRQADDNYLARIGDLERISRGFTGVTEAFAVQGGREVRVYVSEERVDDLGAVDLSTAIAAKISNEMRFPGQIRVTVIRELKAIEVAS